MTEYESDELVGFLERDLVWVNDVEEIGVGIVFDDDFDLFVVAVELVSIELE